MFKVNFKSSSYFKSDLKSVTLFGALCKALEFCLGSEYVDAIYNGDETLVVSNVMTDADIVDTELTRKSGSSKFTTDLKYCGGNMYFLVETSLDKEALEEIIKIAFINGIGAMKSVGYGQFSLSSIEENVVLDDEAGDYYETLSDYIPNKTDSIDGTFSTRIIRSCTINGQQKAPVFVVNAGARFKGTAGRIVGRIIKDPLTGALLSGQSITRRVSNA